MYESRSHGQKRKEGLNMKHSKSAYKSAGASAGEIRDPVEVLDV